MSYFSTKNEKDRHLLDQGLLDSILDDRKKDSAATSDRTRFHALGIIGAVLAMKEKGIGFSTSFFLTVFLCVAVLICDYLQFSLRYFILSKAHDEGKKLLAQENLKPHYYSADKAFKVSRFFFRAKFVITLVALVPFLYGLGQVMSTDACEVPSNKTEQKCSMGPSSPTAASSDAKASSGKSFNSSTTEDSFKIYNDPYFFSPERESN